MSRGILAGMLYGTAASVVVLGTVSVVTPPPLERVAIPRVPVPDAARLAEASRDAPQPAPASDGSQTVMPEVSDVARADMPDPGQGVAIAAPERPPGGRAADLAPSTGAQVASAPADRLDGEGVAHASSASPPVQALVTPPSNDPVASDRPEQVAIAASREASAAAGGSAKPVAPDSAEVTAVTRGAPSAISPRTAALAPAAASIPRADSAGNTALQGVDPEASDLIGAAPARPLTERAAADTSGPVAAATLPGTAARPVWPADTARPDPALPPVTLATSRLAPSDLDRPDAGLTSREPEAEPVVAGLAATSIGAGVTRGFDAAALADLVPVRLAPDNASARQAPAPRVAPQDGLLPVSIWSPAAAPRATALISRVAPAGRPSSVPGTPLPLAEGLERQVAGAVQPLRAEIFDAPRETPPAQIFDAPPGQQALRAGEAERAVSDSLSEVVPEAEPERVTVPEVVAVSDAAPAPETASAPDADSAPEPLPGVLVSTEVAIADTGPDEAQQEAPVEIAQVDDLTGEGAPRVRRGVGDAEAGDDGVAGIRIRRPAPDPGIGAEAADPAATAPPSDGASDGPSDGPGEEAPGAAASGSGMLAPPAPRLPGRAAGLPGRSAGADAADAAQEAPASAAAPRTAGPALVRNARSFDNPQGLPLIAVVIRDAPATAAARQELAEFPAPLTFAIDPLSEDAAARADLYRAANQEIVLEGAGLPVGAAPQDVEVALSAHLSVLPEAIGLMDREEGGFSSDRAVTGQVLDILAADGHGLLLWDRGLNAAYNTAQRSGQPAALIYRQIDMRQANAAEIGRRLDRAAFEAARTGGVVVVADALPQTLAALSTWLDGNRASQIALAPLSALMVAE